MSSATERKVIKDLFKKLQKRVSDSGTLLDDKHEVLEQLVFASFLENTKIEDALEAFSVLERYFIDWNEVRVSTANELAELFCKVYFPARVGERIRRILQWIFEVRYKFDLEDMRSKESNEIVDFFHSIPYSTAFMNQYMELILCPSEVIPLDEGAWRVLRLLECVEINEDNHEKACGLEVLTSAKDRRLFFVLLHDLATEMMDDAKMAQAIEFLKTIDPEAGSRTWLPLVESDVIDDPVLIAKQFSQKERSKRHFPIVSLEADLDDLDEDNYESLTMVDEEDSFSETETEYADVSVNLNVLNDEEDSRSKKKESGPKGTKVKEKTKGKERSKDNKDNKDCKEKISLQEESVKDKKDKSASKTVKSTETISKSIEQIEKPTDSIKKPIEKAEKSVGTVKKPSEPSEKLVESIKKPSEPLKKTVSEKKEVSEPIKKVKEHAPSERPERPLEKKRREARERARLLEEKQEKTISETKISDTMDSTLVEKKTKKDKKAEPPSSIASDKTIKKSETTKKSEPVKESEVKKLQKKKPR